MKPRRNLIISGILAAIAISLAVWGVGLRMRRGHPRKTQLASQPQRVVPAPRIVSLAPSTTESLYALGLGEHMVGVSRFCDFPPAVTNLARVGGLTDVDLEAIVRLLPDAVVAPSSQLRAKETLSRMGIKVVSVEQNTLPQIMDSMWQIGDALERSELAAVWLQQMDAVIAHAKSEALGKEPKPRVLVCIGRETAALERVYIAGKGNFYNDVLEVVGAVNAYQGNIAYPVVSIEGLMRLNPDIIIEILPESGAGGFKLRPLQAVEQWRALPPETSAVAKGQIHIVTESWAVRPGPRIGFLIERFAQLVQAYN